MKVEFYRHSLTQKDIDNVTQVLNSIFLTTGAQTAKFEEGFSRYTGINRTIALSSCTAALHLALLALDIGPGDEVITTPMSFIATSNAVLHAGATPVFVDVEESTGLIDPDRVARAITDKTKAILPVHLFGCMADMAALKKIADAHAIKIIEDCAHCIEGERDGVRPGELGHVACYSFYATKNLTCGEGGAAAVHDSYLADRLLALRLHGMSKDAAKRYTGYYQHWDMICLGWKYNLDDIHAALLVDQIATLDERWQLRDNICKAYDSAFSGLPGIEIPETRGKSARHLYTLWVDPEKRDDYLHRLQDYGIGVAVNYRSIHSLRYYREQFGFKPETFPVSERIGSRTLSLPLYPGLTEEEVSYVIDMVKKTGREVS